ncbi:MAG: hypothetical protein RL591_1694 [Planctomycetota bacterium]
MQNFRTPIARIVRIRAHSSDAELSSPDKLRLKRRLAVFEEERNHFLKVRLKFFNRLSLRMSARPTRNVADVQPGPLIVFNDEGE